MKALTLAGILVTVPLSGAVGQGLREVPQRFAYIQPIGLAVGVGQAGIEFSIGRTTSVEIGGVGVYSEQDGVRIWGGGPGVGIRQYLGSGQKEGLVVAGRVDGVWLTGDNSRSDVRFLAVGPFATRETRMFLGMGVLLGYRWVTRSGLVLEPGVGYEYFAGRRPLVAGSRDLQEELGVTVGLAIGWAW